QHKSCWRGKVYRNSKIKYENRKVLLQILDYCKKAEIKTVFWNKEDPVFFDNKTYNFVDTALNFDYIYTTAEECVEKYKQLGHKNVDVLEFGFSPKLFNSRENGKKEYKAVFAGSWYGDLQERCKDMMEIFDMVLSKKIPLEIYDRQGNSSNPIHKFPEKYKEYIHPPVDYEKLGKILENATFGININTEKKSQTMFARRVFELMACRCIVISNYSKGIKRLFGNNVWFMGEDFYLDDMEKIRNENYNFVINNCDTKNKFKDVCKKVLC
ncbi:MAG: CgeB family protein, partial [Anaerotignaceae bacterium]